VSGIGATNGRVARAGDATAAADVALLYERYATRVRRSCVRRLGCGDDAADAVQDTFLRAWLALRDGVEVRHPLPWLLTIADNVCVSRFRARAARVATTELSERAKVEFPEAIGEVARLAEALGALPDRQRRALLRRELQGYSYDEIGDELGASRASVTALIHRARLAVADRLRNVAALVPVPGFLRAAFDGGAASVAAAGTGAVAIAVGQVALPAPDEAQAAPNQPARVVTQATTTVAATRLIQTPSRTIAQRSRAKRRESGSQSVSTDSARAPRQAAQPTTPTTPELAPVPDTTPFEPETTTEPTSQTQTPAPAVDVVVPAQPEGQTSGRGHTTAESAPPGQQPKGAKGHSASAPGHAPESSEPGPAKAHGNGKAIGHEQKTPKFADEGPPDPELQAEPAQEELPAATAPEPSDEEKEHGPPPGHGGDGNGPPEHGTPPGHGGNGNGNGPPEHAGH
jgi:RNA polymerase sigma factor (sigma-70 family)